MSTQQTSTKQIVLNIDGMGCSGCANTVREALESNEGITEAIVDLENDIASVTYNTNDVSIDDFKKAIEEAGYEFVGIR